MYNKFCAVQIQVIVSSLSPRSLGAKVDDGRQQTSSALEGENKIYYIFI